MSRFLDTLCAVALLCRLWFWMDRDRACRVYRFLPDGDWCWKYMAYDMIETYPSMPTSPRVEPERLGTMLIQLAQRKRST